MNLRRPVLLGLRAYQLLVSPWLPASCKYVPTCSQYAMDAVSHYGLLRGGMKSLQRLLRCHPFSRGGCDPAF